MTILAQWDGEGFKPIGRYIRQCDAEMVIGQVYTLDVILERSDSSHRHYFAQVNELWLNLPEGLDERFKSAEHLRKYALIRAGYADERSVVCANEFEAAKVAAFVAPMDEYAVVAITQNVVTVYTAKSQSYKTMDKGEFQKSKEAVLEVIGAMIGVTRKQIEAVS